MNLQFEKYQGAGNDFVIINSLNDNIILSEKTIHSLCDRNFGIGADGLMILYSDKNYDFRMSYFNSDGKEGSMCGNGGRCIAQFAYKNNICNDQMIFSAVDGLHTAEISDKAVKLKMNDVVLPSNLNNKIIETGSPHIIIETDNLKNTDVYVSGKKLRYNSKYQPGGTNVNFIEEISSQEINQRTYERGVENETLSCGTGAIAGAVYQAVKHKLESGRVKINMPGGTLFVEFKRDNNKLVEIYLTGPAEKVFKGEISI